MPDFLKTGLKLCLIVVVATFALALTNMLTEDRIEAIDAAKSGDAVKMEVLPDAEKFIELEAPSESDYPNVLEVFDGKKGDELVGYVIRSSAKGYDGTLETLVGITNDGSLGGMRLVKHTETKGIGTKAEEPEFYEQFNGLSTTDPLEIDTITGATFTTEGVKTAVSNAIAYYQVEIGGEAAEPVDPMAEIFPNAEFSELELVSDYPDILEVYEAKENDALVGYIIISQAKGYGDTPLQALVGIDTDSTIEGYRLGENSETPGLGTKIGEPEFYEQFIGKSAEVQLEDGDIDMISNATYSSKGAETAINNATEYYQAVLLTGGGN